MVGVVQLLNLFVLCTDAGQRQRFQAYADTNSTCRADGKE
jgi:hypothetical protein